VFYLEIVDAVLIDAPAPEVWLLPSITLSALCAKLPIGSNKEIAWEPVGGFMTFKSGRMSAKISMMASEYYPVWDPFDPDDLELVTGFGGRVDMVSWAAATKGEPPLSGVYFDGESVVATDRYRIAKVPCVAEPIYKPITVPANIFTPISRQLVDVKIAVQGEFLCMMPDDSTQIKAIIYAHPFPNLTPALDREQSHSLKVKKQPFIELIDRASVMVGAERVPLLRLYIGEQEIAAYMEQQEVGMLGDVIDIPGHATHDRVEIDFTPKNLLDALSHAPSEEIEFWYDVDRSKVKPVKIDGGSGYTALVMPRTQKEVDNG
jgi:DNA polymerase III sliding clamp (beta) subunit (PCNA family)